MRLSRRLSVFLMVSVGINLFFAGMLVTQWLTEEPPEMAGPFNRYAALAALGEDYRPVVQELWVQNEAANRDKLYRARQIRARLRELLTAETFDRAALEESFTALRDAMDPLADDIFSMIAEIAEALPPEERRRYFETGLAGLPTMPEEPFDRRPREFGHPTN